MQIRKISIGSDYKSDSMNYAVGQKAFNGKYTIHLIEHSIASKGYKIYVENDNEEVFLWKFFNDNMPIAIEYNIDF